MHNRSVRPIPLHVLRMLSSRVVGRSGLKAVRVTAPAPGLGVMAVRSGKPMALEAKSAFDCDSDLDFDFIHNANVIKSPLCKQGVVLACRRLGLGLARVSYHIFETILQILLSIAPITEHIFCTSRGVLAYHVKRPKEREGVLMRLRRGISLPIIS
jgi:hypothetical protein